MKAERIYVEKCNRLLTVHSIGDQIVLGGDSRSVTRATRNKPLLDAIKQLLEDARGEENDEEEEEYIYMSTEEVIIPPLFAQIGDKAHGWASKTVEVYLVLLLNILGAGKGGTVSLTDKKTKPAWFTTKVNWNKFQSPSHSTMVENVDIIKGIFSHFNLDVKTHCLFPPPPAEDPEELQPEEQHPAQDHRQQEQGVEENDQAGVEEVMEGDPLPNQFLFEATVANTEALHATTEDLAMAAEEEEESGREEVDDVGEQVEAGGEQVEVGGEGEEDTLPDPEKYERPPAVVQVIVQRRKRKNVEDLARTTSKRAKKVPNRLLDYLI